MKDFIRDIPNIREVFRNEGRVQFSQHMDCSEALRLYRACDCSKCDNWCIHRNRPERFPRGVFDDSRSQCANLVKALGEPFTWVDEFTGEVHCIPKSIIAQIMEGMNEQ